MANAKETVALDINVNTSQADASVGGFKKQLREATAELVNMSMKFGETSKQAQDAAKKVAGLKDAIGDAKALADTFNPDKKFVALGGALQGATAGFSAFQGAMGVFGSEGKEVEKVLLKVQSAMALQQGISGIAGALDSFKLLKGEIVGGVTKAFSTLKGAIIGTGIGLLVVALGLVVANFDKVKAVIEKLIGPLKNITDFFGRMINAVTDFVGITSKAERALDSFTKASNRARESVDQQIKLLQAQGGQEEKIYALKKANIESELNDLREALKVKGKLTEEEQKQFRDLRLEQQVIDIEEKKRLSDNAAKAQAEKEKLNEKNKAAQDKIDAEKQKQIDKEIKANQDLQDALKKSRENAAKEEAQSIQDTLDAEAATNQAELDRVKKNGLDLLQAKADLAALNEINNPTDPQKKIDKLNADFALEMATTQANDLQKQVMAAEHRAAVKKINDAADKEAADAEKAKVKIVELTEAQKLDIIINAANSLSEIVGKETAAGKALAVAGAIINTYKGITAALTLPPPFSFIAAAVSAATGFAAVKKIIATKLPGKAGGGSAPSMSMPSIPAPIRAQTDSTRIDQASINQIGNASANRSYVLESDVSGNQERITRLNRAARIN